MFEGRHWCFTSYKDELEYKDDSMLYMVYGREVCPSTGRRHLQGFVSFNKRRKLGIAKKLLGDEQAHMEIKRGSVQEASDYCKKDGDFVEFGEKPQEKNVAGGEARRRQYDSAWELAKSGDFEPIESSIKLHCWSAITKIHAHYKCRRQLDDLPAGSIVGTWICGPPGVGKSFFARTAVQLRNLEIFNKPLNKWWDGYNDQPVILIEDIDEFSAKHMSHHIKIWTDEYPFIAEVKGFSWYIRPRHVIVTSNYSIEFLWREDSTLSSAIKRRFHCVDVYSREDFDRVSWPSNSTLHGVPEEIHQASSSNPESCLQET